VPISWALLNEVEVTDAWQTIADVTSDVFRITTTVTDVPGWESERIRSGAYIRFIYPDSLLTKSKKIYVPVSEDVMIYDLPIPREFKDKGYILRSISCRLSSRWVGKINFLNSFAKWNLKLEELI